MLCAWDLAHPSVANGQKADGPQQVALKNAHDRKVLVAFWCESCKSFVRFGQGGPEYVEIGAGLSKSPSIPHSGNFRLVVSPDGKGWNWRGAYKISSDSPFKYEFSTRMVLLTVMKRDPESGKEAPEVVNREEFTDKVWGRLATPP